MSVISWALYTEQAVGRGHPTLTDVINRPLRQVITVSGADPDVDFAGFALKAHTHVAANVTDLATAATGITKVGTIDTGVWQGSPIASAYLGAHTHPFSQLTALPSTLAGYGILDAYTKAAADALLATKVPIATSLAGYGITDALANSGAAAGTINFGQAGGTFAKRTLTAGAGISVTENVGGGTVTLAVTTVPWGSLTSTPTTLAAYGITNAYTSAQVDTFLTALNATNLTTGTLPAARFPTTLPAIDGSALTALNASSLSAGIVAGARLSGSYANVTGVGVLGAGTWQATPIADTYLASLAVSKLTGTVLPGSIVTSSLTSVGVLTSLSLLGTVTLAMQSTTALSAAYSGANAVHTLLSVLPTATGNANQGPFAMSFGSVVFNSTQDPIMNIGYNSDANGVLMVAGEPAYHWGLEANYNDASGHNKMENYAQYQSADGLTRKRPHFIQMDRVTHKVSSHVLTGDVAIMTDVDPFTTQQFAAFQVFPALNRTVLSSTIASSDTELHLKAAGGFHASQYFYDTGSATPTAQLFSASAVGVGLKVVGFGGTTLLGVANWYGKVNGAAGAGFAIGVDDNGALATFDAAQNVATAKGLIVRAGATMSGNLFEAQTSALGVLAALTPAGLFGLGTGTPRTVLDVRSQAQVRATTGYQVSASTIPFYLGFPNNQDDAAKAKGYAFEIASAANTGTGNSRLTIKEYTGFDGATPFDIPSANYTSILTLSAGNVGIGTVAPTSKLHVIGSVFFNGNIGFNGNTPQGKGTVTGSRGANAALASLLTYLASRGDIVDSTT